MWPSSVSVVVENLRNTCVPVSPLSRTAQPSPNAQA